ncbi:sigma-54-dependent transcriptional regulator [Hydrogenobacter hydrogenophilus]|uniref:Two-component system, NtrC family, response regulator n=1 Tax=Hydrogenobacter hydrogenophilus TaxID=35835 RepID=A0A285NU40_9AQUI|nr:sigma-54 dependent transcriptional regulator [Hydrogenobacter hydrogenophilus]SNZ12992.1 two-component system, NtrC family, response regulator [Hydrogenobacter hydrogenophilus]
MKLLIVEDEHDLGRLLKEYLEDKGYKVYLAENGSEALELLERQSFDLILLDLLLPDVDGMQILESAKLSQPLSEVIVLTGHGTVKVAVEAMKKGAYDFLTKPCTLEEIETTLEKAYQSLMIKKENKLFKRERNLTEEEFVFESPKMRELLKTVEKIACSDCPVLLVGETGVGKELIARIIHSTSDRREKPFIAINIASIPKDLLEAELFGYEKGAFTGAGSSKEGFFELADGGVLFLDEISEIEPSLQAKLLRAIETKKFYRVGGRKEIESDVRIISATNRNLKELIKEGKFREDLYFRLNTFELHIPPLRERKEDMIPLAQHFLKKFSAKYSKNIKGLTKEAEKLLLSYNFPGNVRELKNIMERACLLCDDEYLDEDDLSFLNIEEHKLLKELERKKIEEVLKEVNYNKKLASEILGIPLRTLYRKIEKYGIKAQP